MALVLKSKATRNASGTEVYVEVVTATGVYDVDDNPGGFGTPNPVRNTLALIFYGLHKKSTADVLCVPAAYTPESVTSFTIAITDSLNGHLEYNVFAVPIFDPIGSYSDGAIVYDNQNASAPFVKKRVSAVWVPVTVPSLLLETSIVQVNGHAFPIPAAETYVNQLNGQQLKLLRSYINEECQADTFLPEKYSFEYVDALLNGAIQDWCHGYYNEAQLKIEELLAYKDFKEAA